MRISLASPTAAAFLVIVASGLPHGIFEACTMFTNVTARTLCFPPNRGVFLKCFRPFVASWPAPSASGRSESGRVGITPTELVHLRQGTHNNTCERALKKAILHRKNALFCRTLAGAHVGDVFMSLIHTAELNHIAPFEYLVALQRNAAVVAANAADWMRWNYQVTLAHRNAGPDPPA